MEDARLFKKIVATISSTAFDLRFTKITPLAVSGFIKRGRLLGQGAYAKVFLIHDSSGAGFDFAVRIAQKNNTSKTNASIILARYAMAPTIYFTGEYKEKNKGIFRVTVMDVIRDSVYNLRHTLKTNELYDAFRCLLDKKYLLGFLHGDMHLDNIVLLRDGKTLGFIDFDFSYFKVPPKYNMLDFIPLIGSCYGSRDPKLQSLATLLNQYYKEKFNISIEKAEFKTQKIGGYYYSKYFINTYSKKELVHFDAVFPTLRLPVVT